MLHQQQLQQQQPLVPQLHVKLKETSCLHPPTTTTTTTTTRAPTPCEIERDELLASNPTGQHVPVCMSGDGSYRPDQYQADGVNFCYDTEGKKIEGSVVFDGAQSGRYNECLAMRS